MLGSALLFGLASAQGCAGAQLRYAYPAQPPHLVEVLADLDPGDDGRLAGELRTLLGTAGLTCAVVSPGTTPAPRPLHSYAHHGETYPIAWGWDEPGDGGRFVSATISLYRVLVCSGDVESPVMAALLAVLPG